MSFGRFETGLDLAYGGCLVTEPSNTEVPEKVDDEFDLQQLQTGFKTVCDKIKLSCRRDDEVIPTTGEF